MPPGNMQIAYPHIAERLFGRPHAIEPVALRAIMDGPLARRVLSGETIGSGKVKKNGRDLRRARLAAISGANQVREAEGLIEYALTPEGIAIVPIAGVLSRRFDWLAAACGWTTYEGLAATIESILDGNVARAILFDVDTPGGEASEMLDVADAILAARKKIPVWAVANVCAASAGYALAGSAEKLVLPRLAVVGSIGCMLVHIDQSVADLSTGLKYTAVYSGARKIDGWAHAPLSDGALNAAQTDVDHVRNAFAALVGRQGRISAKAALATEAAVFVDNAAVEAGLADAVMTFDEALAALTQQATETTTMAKTAALQSTSSPAALAAGIAAPGMAAAADPVALPAPQAKKLNADVDPPKPGEKCALCGQVMPDDDDEDNDAGDENGDNKEQQAGGKGKKKTQQSPAAVAAAYTTDDAAEVNELCTIAGVPQKGAAFIRAKTPAKQVRSQLAALAVEASGDEISASQPPRDGNAEAAVAAAWDQVVAELNQKNGFKKTA